MIGIQRVGIVGAGQMGAGIAEVCARASLDVLVCETDDDRVDAAHQRIEAPLACPVHEDKLTTEVHDRAQSHLRRYTKQFRTWLTGTWSSRQSWRTPRPRLTSLLPLTRSWILWAILTSNTSPIPILNLGMAAGGPCHRPAPSSTRFE